MTVSPAAAATLQLHSQPQSKEEQSKFNSCKEHRSSGTVPDSNGLPKRLKPTKSSDPISVGIVPVSKLLCSQNHSVVLRSPNSDGIVPESLLSDNASLLMTGNLPNSVNIVPVNAFSAKNRFDTLGKSESSVGILDDSMLLKSLNSVRFRNKPLKCE